MVRRVARRRTSITFRSRALGRRRTDATFGLAVAICVAACGGETGGSASHAVRDSAGIEIVESTAPRWTEAEAWRIADAPEVSIGVADGDEPYLLSDVRGARRLPDGRIAVLDAGSSRVRIYASDGTHLTDIAGPGAGPGELQRPQFLGLVADTFVVYEFLPGSLSWFGPDGSFIRRADTPRLPGGEFIRAMMFGLLDGSYQVGRGVPLDREEGFEEGLNRAPMPLWGFDVRDAELDSLGLVPGFEEVIDFPRENAIRHTHHLFGKTGWVTASADRIFSGDDSDYSVKILDRTGATRRIIRKLVDPIPTTESDRDGYIRQRIELEGVAGGESRAYEEAFRSVTMADHMPAYRFLQADTEGNLWVEEWEGVGLGQGPFSVFDADGAWLGSLDLPDGLPAGRGQLYLPWMEIGSDYLLGVWVDDLGIEQVRLYRIEKPEG